MSQVSVSEHAERKATWFELFFDLAVVSALASSVHAYRHHPGFDGGLLCLIMFAAVWVSWTAMTFYSDRFDSDSVMHRLAYFAQMLGVGFMAIGAGKVGHRDITLFVIGFVFLRSIVSLLYFNTYRTCPDLQALAFTLMRQNILVTILWGISLATSFEVSLSLWGFAIVLDLFTPFLYQRVLSAPAARLSKTHLPERFGLFYILVLGECVNAAIGPLTQSDSVVSSSLIFTCIIGLAMAFGVWWLYFNNLDEDVTLHSIKSLGVWELSHFVLGFSTLMLAHCLYFGLITNLPANEWKYLPFVTGGSLGMVLVCLGTLHTVCYLNNPTVVGLRQLRGRFAGAIVIIVMGFLDMKSMTHFFSYVIVLALLIALDSFFERTQKA